MVAASATPSPFGEMKSGMTERPASTGSPGGGSALPSVPPAGRTAGPALIVHAYLPAAAPAELHVQETAVPVPEPDATAFLLWSVTVTVQCRALASLA